MASTPQSSLTRKRILANAGDRKKGGPEGPTPEEEAAAAAQAEAAERILSQPVRTGKAGGSRKKRRKSAKGRSVAQIGLLAALVVGGIGAIIGLRYFAEMSGVNWVGE